MAPLLDRKTLEGMKRADLQKLCKDYGVKANLKSEALIDLLVETQKPIVRPPAPTRSTSTRQSSRVGPSRLSSVVIYHTGDELKAQQELPSGVTPRDSKLDPTPRATRTKKAKEQARLGVGRPKVAGGSGPRAITRSVKVSQRTRGKLSRTPRLVGDSIPEETAREALHLEQVAPDLDVTTVDSVLESSVVMKDRKSSLLSLETVDKHVADAIRPLYEQMESFKSELQSITALRVDLELVGAQANEICMLREKVETLTVLVQDLQAQMESSADLEAELKQTKDKFTAKLLPQELTPPTIRTDTISSSGLPTTPVHSTTHTKKLLGKRQRDPISSNIHSDTERDESSGPRNEAKPAKRAKLSGERERSESASEHRSFGGIDGHEGGSQLTARNSVRNDPPPATPFQPFIDPPPPIDRLPDFFPPSPPLNTGPTLLRFPTTTANASENQQPFSFSYFPLDSDALPPGGTFMPSFPYPEPPQSPSPMGSPHAASSSRMDRADPFQIFKFPAPSRPARSSGARNLGANSAFINPGSYVPKNVGRDMDAGSSTAGLGTAEEPHLKRTMYGTELEGDTRFGDFGIEGVGNSNPSFWAGGRM